MEKVLELTSEDKNIIFDIVVNQYYALELVGSEIADIESGRKQVEDERLKQLNDLYDRLVRAGY